MWQVEALEKLAPSTDGADEGFGGAVALEPLAEDVSLEPLDSVMGEGVLSEEASKELRDAFLTQPIYRSAPSPPFSHLLVNSLPIY